MLRTLLAVLVVAVFAVAVASTESPSAPERLPALRLDAPQWFKGNLHTHSLWSDGDDFPEMIADWYKRNGYQFLALTEHNVLAEGEKWIAAVGDAKSARTDAVRKYAERFGPRWVERREIDGKAQVRLKPMSEYRSTLEEPGTFLLVPGEEITHKFAKNPVHMNGINIRDVIKPIDGRDVAETVALNLRLVADQRAKTKRPMLALLNHPNFVWGVRAEDMLLAEELRFFEVFNGHPIVRNYGDDVHASCERIWDIVLALRLGKLNLPIVYGMATDDSHQYHAYGLGKVNPGRGWVMVRAPFLTAEAVVTAMEAGDFYSSSGVTLDDVRREGDQLVVAIRPEKGVQYTTRFIATFKGTSLDSTAKLDKDGKPLEVTREYDNAIGKVVAEVKGTEARYTFTGQELYVRANIISTKPHPNPYAAGDVETAWVQPIQPRQPVLPSPTK